MKTSFIPLSPRRKAQKQRADLFVSMFMRMPSPAGSLAVHPYSRYHPKGAQYRGMKYLAQNAERPGRTRRRKSGDRYA